MDPSSRLVPKSAANLGGEIPILYFHGSSPRMGTMADDQHGEKSPSLHHHKRQDRDRGLCDPSFEPLESGIDQFQL